MPGLPPGGSRRKAHEARCKQYPGRLPVYSDFRASACGHGRKRDRRPCRFWHGGRHRLLSSHRRANPWVGVQSLAQQGFAGIPTFIPTLRFPGGSPGGSGNPCWIRLSGDSHPSHPEKSLYAREKFFTRCLVMLPTCRRQNFFDVRLWSRGFWVGGVGGRSNPCWARLSAPIRPPTLFFSGGMGGSPRLAVASRLQTWGAARPPTRCRPWPPAMGRARTQKRPGMARLAWWRRRRYRPRCPRALA